MLSDKQWKKYLTNQSNKELLEMERRGKRFYEKDDISVVKKEIAKRKQIGLMRTSAGIKRAAPRRRTWMDMI